MYKVVVEKECGCFKKSDYENNIGFKSKEDALSQALEMSKDMNEIFCQKHEFQVVENDKEFKIMVNERAKSGCCGGGHCS